MKKLEIEIPEGYEVDLDKSDLKKGLVVFKEVKKEYPKHVSEIDRQYHLTPSGGVYKKPDWQGGYINDVSSKKRAEAVLALIQLVELRDAWNKIDGFIADWTDVHTTKYVIYSFSGYLAHGHDCLKQYTLHFGSSETRDLFLETFRDLIETAKEFL